MLAMLHPGRQKHALMRLGCTAHLCQVWKGNEVRHLGYYGDEEEAAQAYDRAVLALRGPGAPTNFAAEHYLGPAAEHPHPDALAAAAARMQQQPGGPADGMQVLSPLSFMHESSTLL